MEGIDNIMNNWDVIMATVLVVLASADKVAMIAIRTVGNIRDSWRETFPKKIKDEPPLS